MWVFFFGWCLSEIFGSLLVNKSQDELYMYVLNWFYNYGPLLKLYESQEFAKMMVILF